VAYYLNPKKKGLSLKSQKAIINHFVALEKSAIAKEFKEQGDKTTLKQAVAYALKHQYRFIIATLDCLSDDLDSILSIKKKLGNLFQSCDLPANDSLTISIVYNANRRNKLLSSIKTKAAFQTRKQRGKSFGNPQNLTARGRQLGLAKIKTMTTSNNQKILKVIEKCRKAGLGW
jgi:hypothetical protein